MDGRQQRKQDHDRRRLWRVLAIAAVVGLVLLLGFDAWLRYTTRDQNIEQAIQRIALASLVLRLAAAGAAALLGRFLLDWARQSRDQGQWPPAGLDWPGQTIPCHGDQARQAASRIRFAGIAALAVAALLVAVSAWRLFA